MDRINRYMDNETLAFGSSHDRMSQWTTLVMSAFFALAYSIVIRNFNSAELTFRIGLLFAFVLIVAMPYAISVRRFEFRPEGLAVRYILWERLIPYYDITDISFPFEEKLTIIRRVVGTFGYFGYSGKYNTKKGLTSVASNRREELIFFIAKGKPMLIGPDSPREFFGILRNYVESDG